MIKERIIPNKANKTINAKLCVKYLNKKSKTCCRLAIAIAVGL
jgi:hypothetical protein